MTNLAVTVPASMNRAGMDNGFPGDSVRITRFFATVFVLSAFIDVTQKLLPGAAITLLYVAWCWVPFRSRWRDLRQRYRTLYPLFLFVLWTALSVFLHPASISGLQNIAVVAAFLGFILLGSRTGIASGIESSVVLSLSAFLCSAIYLISAAATFEVEPLAGARSFALFALFGVAWYLAGWCTRSHAAVLYSILLLLLIAFSLSRTAFVAGALLFCTATLIVASRRKTLKIILTSVSLAAVLLLLVLHFTNFTQRFSSEDQTIASVEVGDVDLDTSGRLVMWSVIWESYLESPWTGRGAGAASEVLQETLSGISHPHCDYLRVLHDYGAIGLALFVLGMFKLLAALWKAWRSSATAASNTERFHLATLFAFGALVVAMLTDNCLSYIYLMAPMAIMIGASLHRRGDFLPVSVQHI